MEEMRCVCEPVRRWMGRRQRRRWRRAEEGAAELPPPIRTTSNIFR